MLTATASEGVTSFVYDSADRLLKVSYPSGRFLEFAYDAGGRRTQSIDQEGFTIHYEYDAAGRLARLTNGSGDPIVSYTYDTAGQLTLKDLGNGTYTTYQYDAARQLEAVFNYAADGSVNSSFEYGYDVMGRRISMRTLDGDWAFGYDPTGRLNLVTPPSGRTIEYRYDAAGNRIAVVDNGVETRYTTNNLDQYTMVGSAVLSYDADGNLVSWVDGSDVRTFVYDDQGHLISLTTPEGTWSYEYDVFGNRTAMTHEGECIEYLLDPVGLTNVVGEYDGSDNLLSRYVHGFGLVSRMNAVGEAFYYDFDAIGSTVGLSGPTGSYINEYSYLPFGEALTVTETISNPFTFIGELGVMAEESSLSYMRNRYYLPELGRFATIDPLRIPPVGLYAYTSNNPIHLVDPSGLQEGGMGGFLQGLQRLQRAKEEGFRMALRGEWPDDEIQAASQQIQDNAPAAIMELQLLRFPASTRSPTVLIPLTFWARATQCSGETDVIHPRDPNDMVGPAGFGEEHWVTATETLPYTIRFENAAAATAPAQQVVITQQLDDDLDWRTFRVDDFGWGDLCFYLPGNRPFYQGQLDLTATHGFFVDVTATIDVSSGVATWTITTIDPETGEQPVDASVGFLPPDDGTGRGDGFVSYTVRPRRTAVTGDIIDAQASIIFDTEEPIDTPPILNTLDALAPTSAVGALPETTEETEFLVSWSGSDDEGGSAVADFTTYVSIDSGPFKVWLSNTQATESLFIGELGHSYAFYSIARDNAGNLEPPPAIPDSHITVLGQGSIEGVNFEDLDGNGVRDEAEPGLSGWTVYLDANDNGMLDDGERSTVTDTDGAYAFPNLGPGTYVVAEVLQAGWVQTAPTEGTYNVTMTSGLNVTGLDFGNQTINDAPVNAVPGPQSIDEDTVLVFSNGAGNAINISDPDAGSNPVEVTLAITDGILTLGGTAGLDFMVGDGIADSTMTFSGTLASINMAVGGLSFQPNADFNGSAILELTTNDLGNTGAGGPQSDTDIVGITILGVNDTPVADAGPDILVNEGNLVTRFGVFTDPDVGDTHVFLWEVRDTDGKLVTTTNEQTIQFTPVDDDGQPYTASFTVTDSGGASGTATFVIAVNNIVPVVDAGFDITINEGSAFTSTGFFTDPGADNWTATVDYGDGSGVQPLVLNPDKTFSLSHVYADNRAYTVTVGVTDDDLGVGSDTAVVTVNNVAPVITAFSSSAPNVGDAKEGQKITISGLFADVGTLDTHTATIDWGDGTKSAAVITEKNGSGSLSGSHKYTKGGIFDVKVNLSDDDGGITMRATTALISGAGINGRVLQIVGTAGKDDVEVNAKGKKNELIEVEANFLSDKCHTRTFSTSDFDSIVIMVGDGNDQVEVDQKIVKPVLIDGGAGNDHLNAGRGPAVLIGGAGNDILIGSLANDNIYGGDGNDVIFGSGGADLLDGGSGNDIIYGSWGNDKIVGGDGNDVLYGDDGNDTIDAGAGNDLVFGGRGDDTIAGGTGNDIIFGGSGNDKLDGGSGNDRLFGGRGNDKISGGEGNDLLVGGSGKDTLDGGGGHDKLIDWSKDWDYHVPGNGGCHQAKVSPCASWVKGFVIDLAGNNGTHNPNSGIQVVLPPGNDNKPRIASKGCK
jgi:RHS repeat-associated protein